MDDCYSVCCSCSGSSSRIVHSSWFRADFKGNQPLQIPALTCKPRVKWFSQAKRRHPRPNSWRVYTIHDTARHFSSTICPKIRHSGRCPLCPVYRFGYCRWIIICYHIFCSQRLFAKSWRSIAGRHSRICRKRMRRFGWPLIVRTVQKGCDQGISITRNSKICGKVQSFVITWGTSNH